MAIFHVAFCMFTRPGAHPSISQYYPIIIPANHPYKTILNQMVNPPLAQGPEGKSHDFRNWPRHEADVMGRWASFDGDADRVADPVVSTVLGKLRCFVAVHVYYIYIIYIIYMRYIINIIYTILLIYIIYIVYIICITYIIYICFDLKLNITK